jgi:rRNA maturation endonuclease Nob1
VSDVPAGSVATRVYWGCTTFHCERGFHGTEEDMPREWTQCPACGSELTEITEYQREHPHRFHA